MKEFWIGSYAAKGMPAVQRATLDSDNGRMAVRPVSAEAENPSWVLPHPGGEVLYAVEERSPDGSLAVFRVKEGTLMLTGRLPAGSSPCHLELDGEGEFLFVSNYMDGTLDTWRLDQDGIPQERTAHIVHSGHGLRPDRQEGPHIHACLSAGDLIYSTDLGLDKVFVYRLNRADGTLSEERLIDFPAGSGPRHMAMHSGYPNRLYVNAELAGAVYAVRLPDGEILQTAALIPDDFQEDFQVSAIRFTEDTLYVGSRKRNAIALYSLNADGTLSAPRVRHHRQETPRDVWMDDRWCITADEGSGGLTLLRREGPELEEKAFIPTPGIRPTCVMPVP